MEKSIRGTHSAATLRMSGLLGPARFCQTEAGLSETSVLVSELLLHRLSLEGSDVPYSLAELEPRDLRWRSL